MSKSRERKWTVLVVPHGSGAPRSIPVTERALRVVGSVAVAFLLVVLIGVGVLIARLGSLHDVDESMVYADDPEIVELQSQLDDLNGNIDSIRLADSRLRASVALPSDEATLWERLMRRTEQPRLEARSLPSRITVAPPSAPAAAADLGTGNQPSATQGAEIESTAAAADSLVRATGDVAGKLDALADSVDGARKASRGGELVLSSAWIDSALANATSPPKSPIRVAKAGAAVYVAAPPRTLIAAPSSGRVVGVTAGSNGTYQLVLEHEGGLRSVYDKCGEVLVHEGERVAAGQIIARSAEKPGTPLRYEIRKGAQRIDPLTDLK